MSVRQARGGEGGADAEVFAKEEGVIAPSARRVSSARFYSSFSSSFFYSWNKIAEQRRYKNVFSCLTELDSILGVLLLIVVCFHRLQHMC